MKKLSIGALVAALLLSGAMVGVSFGRGGGITQPTVIELSTQQCTPSPNCRGASVTWDLWGRGEGIIAASEDRLFDVDDSRVGTVHHRCIDWVCTDVLHLTDGEHTERGNVVITGLYRFGDPGSWAITGGTGAYANVRGYARMEGGDERLIITLHLTP